MNFPDDPDWQPAWGMERERHHHQREDGSLSRLERMIAEIRSKLTMNSDLLTRMPASLCDTVLSLDRTPRRCWNGTSYFRLERMKQWQSQHLDVVGAF